MKKATKTVIVTLVTILLLSAIILCCIPRVRVGMFLYCYREAIEDSLSAQNELPSPLHGCKKAHTWEGSHPMTEFHIMTIGDTYYGCYYSPDDVPLPFQNTGETLTQTGENSWQWQGEGDNHGYTAKINPRWYFFRASF